MTFRRVALLGGGGGVGAGGECRRQHWLHVRVRLRHRSGTRGAVLITSRVAGPDCSIVAGIPLMFAAAWWVTGWWRRELGMRPAWVVWAAYATIDLLVLLAAGLSLQIGLLFAVSFATKLAAALLGAKLRLARPA